MEIRIALTPKQREFDRGIVSHPKPFFGGVRGGGKSRGLRDILLKRRFQYPKSIGYIVRKTFPELEANHIAPLFAQYPGLREYYNEGKKTLRLPNGSQLRFGFAEGMRDLVKFQGQEIHDLGIDELGDWLEEEFDFICASNRSGSDGIPARGAFTGNPGGRGHKWIKRRWITRQFTANENPGHYLYIPSRLSDNPALLKADPEYANRLRSIKNETLRRAWLDGDWDITAGTFFDELSRDIHVVEPFDIPSHWQIFGAYDYGFNHPASWQIWAADEDGNVYLVWELVRPKMHFDEQSALVKAHPLACRVGAWPAGLDCWAKKRANDPTIAEEFSKYGITLVQANVNRVNGAAQVRAYLRHQMVEREERGVMAMRREGPRAYFFKTCPIAFDCLSRMVCDPLRPEDVLKVDASEGDIWSGDDSYDCARYALMSRPPISIAPKKVRSDRYGNHSPRNPDPWTL